MFGNEYQHYTVEPFYDEGTLPREHVVMEMAVQKYPLCVCGWGYFCL